MGLFFKSKKRKEAEFMAPQWLKQVEESVNLVNNTKNPDVFFSRYDFLIETLKKLVDIEKYLKFTGDKPSDILRSIKDKKVNTINDFIDRFYKDILVQINKLKTEKAKQKRINNFNELLEPFVDKMEKTNINKFIELNKELNNHLILEEKAEKDITIINNTNDIATVKNNLDSIINSWNIMISFGKSSSKSYEKAVYLARNSTKYNELTDTNGDITHTATYTNDKKDFLKFIILYDLVSNWKSTVFIINGEMVDQKTIGKIKYCYGDKCRSIKSDFCYGASYMTANPFGCHRLQISNSNNSWLKYYEQSGSHYELNRDSMIERIKLASDTFRYCPSFDIENIMNIVKSFPLILNNKEYKELVQTESNIDFYY